MDFNTIQHDSATQQYLQSNLGKLRQLSRIRLQWLCSRYQIQYDPRHTTSDTMIQRILETGLPVPAYHEIKKPADWNKGKKVNIDKLKKETAKEIQEFAVEPEPGPDEDVTTEDEAEEIEDPRKIKNFMQLKKFMKDKGFKVPNTATKASLLKMYDESVEANG